MFVFDDDYENFPNDDYPSKLSTSTSSTGLITARFQFKPDLTTIMSEKSDDNKDVEDFYNDYFVDYKKCKYFW